MNSLTKDILTLASIKTDEFALFKSRCILRYGEDKFIQEVEFLQKNGFVDTINEEFALTDKGIDKYNRLRILR